MAITLIATGPLRRHVQGRPSVSLEADGASVQEALQMLQIPSEVVTAVLVNERLVQKSHILRDGDTVKLVAVLGGG